MEIAAHPFRRSESLRLELEIPIVLLPVVVYHEDACRETMFENV